MLGEVSTQVSEQGRNPQWIDGWSMAVSSVRDALGNWADAELFGGTEKFADLSKETTQTKISLPFLSVGIETALKSPWTATAKLMAKISGSLISILLHLEKGLIGRFCRIIWTDLYITDSFVLNVSTKGRGASARKFHWLLRKILAGTGNTIEKWTIVTAIQYGL